MSHQKVSSSSPKVGRGVKRAFEDQEESRPTKRLKVSENEVASVDQSDDSSSSEEDVISDHNESIMSNHNITPTPAPEQYVLPSIEEDSQPVHTTPERHASSPKNSLEPTDEENSDHSPSGITSSSPFPTTLPSPSAFQPRNASSATVSPTRPSSRSREDFSPSLSPSSNFSSYTSISEGDSDEEDWDEDSDEEDWDTPMFNMWNNPPWQILGPDEDVLGMVLAWEAPAPVVQDWPDAEVALVDDSTDHDGDDHDGDDHYSEDEDEPEDEDFSSFASRYDQWPDFDAAGGENTCCIREDEEESEWDSERDPLHEGPRYPGMNAFRLTGYHWSEPGDQEPGDTYITDDEDDDTSSDEDEDYDDLERDFEGVPEPEAQCRIQ